MNHSFIPYVQYYLSCWRPLVSALKLSLCRNCLWSGEGERYKILKVSWDICTLQKDKGGLGIRNLIEMANRLNDKWIVINLMLPNEECAILIHRNLPKTRLLHHPRWRNPPTLTLFFSWPLQLACKT